MRRTTPLVLAAGATVTYARVVRPRLLRLGSSSEERTMALPGDAIIPVADLVATRAITIDAPAERIWPWLAQMGQGRGGLYSYDALENLVGCEIHSADRIVADWQRVAVGDTFRLHPEIALEVAEIDPPRALVVQGIAPTEQPGGIPYDFVWAFVLVEHLGGTTRLVVRERYRFRSPIGRFVLEPFEIISAFMTRKMLRGIRDRAERGSELEPIAS
jgi:hypothetical protein